jgi:hypothetical protein
VKDKGGEYRRGKDNKKRRRGRKSKIMNKM